MAQQFEFSDFTKRTSPHCVACEAMLADALDEILDGADEAWFEAHVAGCAACAERLSEARRGAAWLEMLKSPRPEPSTALMARIMAETSGAAGAYVPVVTALPAAGNVVPFRPRLPFFGWIEPRLAMTAAMAFFSIALTLNLTGVKLDEVRASDLRPENLKKAFYQADAKAVRTYENLRVVKVMESRVDGLVERKAEPEKKAEPAGKGMSREARPAAKDLVGLVQVQEQGQMQVPFGNDNKMGGRQMGSGQMAVNEMGSKQIGSTYEVERGGLA